MAEATTATKQDTHEKLTDLVAHARRAFRLKQYEQAVDLYGQALESYAGDCNPQSVDLYYLYGLSLLENAIASNGVLGKTEEQPAEEEEEPVLTGVTLRLDIASKAGNASGEGRFVFGADGGEEDPVDLYAQAEAMLKAEDDKVAASEKGVAENGGGGEEEEEPEDDFNAAWEILDLARKTYESMDGDVSRLKLAHTYMALGDVSLETEKFDQAILDVTSALEIRAQHLPLSSRDIADCHFRLSMAYDMTVGQIEKQIEHVEKALASVKAREEDLTGALPNAPESKPVEPPAADPKGKGKATTSGEAVEDPLNWLPKDDKVANMAKGQIESELRDVKAVREDLEAKLEDIKATSIDGVSGTTMDRVKGELDRELGLLGAGPVAPDAPVNDLTGLVKKKKKQAPAADPNASLSTAEATSLGKRKAEDELGVEGSTEKKARFE